MNMIEIIREELYTRWYYKGKHLAIVDDIDDEDKKLRIRVKCPRVAENEALLWARPMFPTTMHWIPKKDDVVWIEFEDWDPERPLIVGWMPADDDIDKDMKDNYNEKYRKWWDYNGNQIEWTEDGLKITDKQDNVIEMKDEGIEIIDAKGKIFIKDSNGNEVTLDSNGIKFKDQNNNEFTGDSSGILIKDKNNNKTEMTSNGIKYTDKNGNTVDMMSGKVQINGTNLEVFQ